MPSTKKRHVLIFRCDAALRSALETIKTRDGIPLNEQLRRAVLLWIDNRKLLNNITTSAMQEMVHDDVRRMGRALAARRRS